jgi:NAD-dependent SIR2 family protein deacetylase
MGERMGSQFVVTSNVDGQFQRIYDESMVYEVHGSIHHLQCFNCNLIIPNTFVPDVNYNEMSCTNLPTCPKCSQNMRPNILMFMDDEWLEDRSGVQEELFGKFISNATQKERGLGIVEIGCGKAVPTIRNICERLYYHHKNSIFIRINT